MSKAKDFRDQSIEELELRYNECRKHLFLLKGQFKTQKKNDKPQEIRLARKDIARLLTVMTEKRCQKQTAVSLKG